MLYLHGGGFVVGGLDSHDDVCAELCQRTGYELVSVDYRLAPEHLHPAAFDDALTAFEWVAKTYAQPILLAGDSAGGNLAAALAHATRGHERAPIGQVLIYPGLGGDMSKGSYVEHAEAPMLTVRDIEFYRDVRSGGPERQGDATVAPLADTDFSGLPPTVVVTAAMRSAFVRRRNLSRPYPRGWRQGMVAGRAWPRAFLSAGTPYQQPCGSQLFAHRRRSQRARQGAMAVLRRRSFARQKPHFAVSRWPGKWDRTR